MKAGRQVAGETGKKGSLVPSLTIREKNEEGCSFEMKKNEFVRAMRQKSSSAPKFGDVLIGNRAEERLMRIWEFALPLLPRFRQ